MNPKEIKKFLHENRIYQWELAEKLGINEFTLSRWLRKPLTKDQEAKIKIAISTIITGRKKR